MSHVHSGRHRANSQTGTETVPQVDALAVSDVCTVPPTAHLKVGALPPTSLTQNILDHIIASTLGDHAIDILLSNGERTPAPCSPMNTVLRAAAYAVQEPSLRHDILNLRELYDTALDFEIKLAKPRTPHENDPSSSSGQVTVPEGESIVLINAAITNVIERFRSRAHLLTSAREAIELSRAVAETRAPSPAPSTAQVEKPTLHPQPPPPSAEHLKRIQRSTHLATFTFGGRWLSGSINKGLATLASATAYLREIVPSIKAIDRPNPKGSLLKRALGYVAEFEIKGLESLASTALGMLAPREISQRFAQTGAGEESSVLPEGESARRKALFKFIIDLRKIRSYFRRNPQLRDSDHRFYCKEPQVLLDREGQFARLDSFLLQTQKGRDIFDAIYQPLSVTSTTEDLQGPTITIPVLPLTPTTLPLPPHHFITGLEYLDAYGEAIEQPERNALRACVAGGALITPPAEARMVRYWHKNIHTHRQNPKGESPLPRSLTAQEFRSFRELLPHSAFDLGEEMEATYQLIREFGDPKDRVMLAGHTESCRGWVYTKDPLIGSFQHAAGDAFLESVYHSRAGICDSMSSVASYLIGDAVGLPGLVVSGPVADGEFFDRKVGHSIALAVLPDSVQTLDLTVASRSSSRISAHRVPIQAQRALASALTQSSISRREIVNIYHDLGDLIRGRHPTRFTAHGLNDYAPVRLWRDLIFDGGTAATHEHNENFPSSPSEEKARSLRWAVEVLQFERIMSRCERSDNFDEFGWFLVHTLKDLYFQPLKDPDQITQSWGVTEHFKQLTQRDIPHEATEKLFSLTRHRKFSQDTVRQFPKISERLSIASVPRFIECLREHDYPNELAAEILDRNLGRCLEHVRYLVKSGKEVTHTIRFLQGVTATVDYYANKGLPCTSKAASDGIRQILHAAKHSGHMNEATPRDVRDLTLALIESLRTVWKAATSEGPATLCDSFMTENPALRGLQILFEREAALLTTALNLNDSDERKLLVSKIAHALVHDAENEVAALNLIRNATQIMGALDLSHEKTNVRSAAKRLLSTFLKEKRDRPRGEAPLINWPDERNPASYLSFISNPTKGGAQALSLLRTLVESNGLFPSEAQTLWPRAQEREVAEWFVRSCDFENGGILKSSEDYEWNLSRLPNLLHSIISLSAPPGVAQTTGEVMKWARSRGEVQSLPEEKHFLETLNLLGSVPDAWTFESSESAIVEGLIEIARGSTPPATLYTALYAIAPYLIAPADEEQAEKHEAWLTDLARTMRECENDTAATQLLARAQRWTKRAPRPLEGTIEGCALACTVADLACQADLYLPALTGAIPFTPFTHVDPLTKDDGTSPHTQVWSSCFPLDLSYPYYDPPKSHDAAALLHDVFRGLTNRARHTLRSPLLHFTASEQGNVKVSGFTGTPESSRPYLRGDEVRCIDWKRSARTDTLSIKVREEREERALTIVADLGTLGREITNMQLDLRRGHKSARSDLRGLVQQAPHLATLIHETMVANHNNLKVDLVLTHHTVIRRYSNAAESILALKEDSDHFWMGIQNDAEMAKKLKGDEEDIFGPRLFQTGSPLAYGQLEIPRRHLIHFLMGPDSQEAIQRTASFLRARGNLVSFGPLLPFRKA